MTLIQLSFEIGGQTSDSFVAYGPFMWFKLFRERLSLLMSFFVNGWGIIRDGNGGRLVRSMVKISLSKMI